VTNNVTRYLSAQKIQFSVYELPEEKLGALETARLLDIDPAMVFKTIVILREKPGKSILAIIPGNREADLKAIAALVGEKKVQVATQKEAEKLTRLQVGGISPLALINQGFLIFLDSSAEDFDQIHISGGQRGLNIKLPTKDLVNLTRARIGLISREENSD
jgi:Cys-tRNA(Pro)/Cys-tRNA(Cys) deacylase